MQPLKLIMFQTWGEGVMLVVAAVRLSCCGSNACVDNIGVLLLPIRLGVQPLVMRDIIVCLDWGTILNCLGFFFYCNVFIVRSSNAAFRLASRCADWITFIVFASRRIFTNGNTNVTSGNKVLETSTPFRIVLICIQLSNHSDSTKTTWECFISRH